MIRLRKPPCPDTFTITPVSPVFNSDNFIALIIQNSKFIIMITTIIHNSEFKIHNYDYYCLLYLLLQATCLLVHSLTRQLERLVYSSTCWLVNFSKFLCLLLKQLVYSLTCQLVYIVRNKGNEKKQNKKRLLCKYLIMGIGNGMKKVITGIFLHVIITIHLSER